MEHVRLLQSPMDVVASRQRLSYLLSFVTLRPARMSPSAVLVVRSMRDPLPGAITRQFASAACPSPAWEHAAQARISALCADAARPARSVVRSAAEAVLFADHSELLACLAMDLGAGAELAWWWKSILRHQLVRGFTALPDSWLPVWAEQPLHVPAALQLLVERKQAMRVLERITPSHAWKLLSVVAQAFGLPPSVVAAEIDEGAAPPASTGNGSPGSPRAPPNEQVRPKDFRDTGARAGHSGSVELNQAVIIPPWEPFVAASAVPVALGRDRRALLGISLLLHRGSRWLENAGFAPRVRAWLAAERAREAGISPHAAVGSPRSPRSALRVAVVAPNSEDGTAGDAGRRARASPLPRLEEESPARQQGATRHGTGLDAAPAVPSMLPSPIAVHPATVNHAGVAPMADGVAAPQPEERTAALQQQLEDGCRTSVGGVFYLIHLLLRSELLTFDVGMRGWALLELLARCLLEREWPSVAADPIWDALAQLDFREPGMHPGAEFTPLETYQAPGSWLRGLDEARRYARFRAARLELWLEEGFLILDTIAPAARATGARMTRRQRRSFGRDASVRAPGLELTPELRRFLRFLLPYVRWRLRSALGDASLTDILRRKGTLYITRSHVDLVMRMKEISVPARIAGLDADPGWRPELGRVVKFHFVDDMREQGWGSQ